MSTDESLIPAEEKPWVPLADGIDFRLLFTSLETGRWTVLLRCQPGSSFGRHKHYGAGEYFVVKGRMEYRMGVALAGTWGYEPLGTIHECTSFPEYTELLFTNHGPVMFIEEDGTIQSTLDGELLRGLIADNAVTGPAG
ncbi:2,4'-dihydroxyacetophenone dioxygenase family protein [Niveispirillum fermenti]|uniref:2,4'-dihydroxyacetophenone dioxygenase family protein n=1 Tax=Niveispirillum fermenti TaxID=1233113 RepID=UPI003A881393